MKYAYTILYVESIPKTVTFYKNAFGFELKFMTPEEDYAELLSGETTISFASIALGNSNLSEGFFQSVPNGKPFGIEIAFTSENIETDLETAINAGAVVIEPLKTKPWGQKVAYVKDLNGFLIEICTPISN